MAVDQVAGEYQEKGYQVSFEERFGKYRADLVVRKGNEKIVFEIKSGKLKPESYARISEIAEYVREHHGFKFHVVVALPPKKKKIEFEGIEDLLFQSLLDSYPNEIQDLSTHVEIDSVDDVEVDNMRIEGATIFMQGTGTINVSLRYGSDSDIRKDFGFEFDDAYPFKYDIEMTLQPDGKFRIEQWRSIEVDTSEFYE